MHMWTWWFDACSCRHGARAEAPEGAQAVIHDNGTGGRNIERKGGRDAYEVPAEGRKLGRQRTALRSKHIGSPQRMGKVRKIGCSVEDFDAHQSAPFRQSNLSHAPPVIKRQVR